MKLIIRTAVAALVITGAFASSQISAAPTSSAKVSVARNSALPIPTCAPDDANACGIAVIRQ
ncbi:MAG: hypothetical protein JWQ42_257 [Edaphobacter sp.]|nr:hypothetical protein [Edaphobacter sp.]